MLVYYKKKFNIYDDINTDIEINIKSIVTRYFNEKTVMWYILISTYTLVVDQIDILHAISKLYELHSKDKVICYCHATAGFLAK